MKTTRRKFIKQGALWVLPSMAGINGIIRAQTLNVSGTARAGSITRPVSGGGGGCTTEQFVIGSTQDDQLGWYTYHYLASPFTTGGSGVSACKVAALLFKFGTIAAGTITAHIYNDSGGSPGSVVSGGSSSTTLDRTTLTTTPTFYDFVGFTASLSASTAYWVVLEAPTLDTDSSNTAYWPVDTTGESGNMKGSELGSSWDGLGGNRVFVCKVYS